MATKKKTKTKKPTSKGFKLQIQRTWLANWMITNNMFSKIAQEKINDGGNALWYWTGLIVQLGDHAMSGAEPLARSGSRQVKTPKQTFVTFLPAPSGSKPLKLTRADFTDHETWIDVRPAKYPQKYPPMADWDDFKSAFPVDPKEGPWKCHNYFTPYPGRGGLTVWELREKGFNLCSRQYMPLAWHVRQHFLFRGEKFEVRVFQDKKEVHQAELRNVNRIVISGGVDRPEEEMMNPPQRPTGGG